MQNEYSNRYSTRGRTQCWFGRQAWFVALLLVVAVSWPAQAARVQDIAKLKGAESSKLVGMGLVVGLNGTGDGGKFMPAMRPLAAMIERLVDPSVVAAELKDAKNVALVTLTAKIPTEGIREGEPIDVQVASIGPAKSLEGGRLFMVPMTGPLPNSKAMAFAEGPVIVQDKSKPTTGIVPKGAQLTENVFARTIDRYGRLQLVIKPEVASWPMAHNLASLVNGLMSPDGPNIARAIDGKTVVVQVPPAERADPAAFISQIMQAYIDQSQINTGARVVINEKTGTIVMTGDVQISPAIVSLHGLVITTMTPAPPPTPEAPRVSRDTFATVDPAARGGANLASLLQAFNQLKVEGKDRIDIIKQLHRSGKLHAQLILE